MSEWQGHLLSCQVTAKNEGVFLSWSHFSLDPFYRIYESTSWKLSAWLIVCPSSLQHFQSGTFKSSQNHLRRHIVYTRFTILQCWSAGGGNGSDDRGAEEKWDTSVTPHLSLLPFSNCSKWLQSLQLSRVRIRLYPGIAATISIEISIALNICGGR